MITATCGRPAFLASCLSQFQRQVYSGFRCEHIVVSDGIDPVAKFLADHWRARYFELESPGGAAGAYAKDVGIREASGDYVCFWDDDNIYEPHALATLYAVANGGDMGVVRVRHRLRTRPGLVTIPRRWNGHFLPGDIDTMCVCVKRTLALREAWGDGQLPPGTDYRWLQKLEATRPAIRYVPTIIGYHL